MKYILVISHAKDVFCSYAQNLADENGFRFLRMEIRDLIRDLRNFSFRDSNGFSFQIGKQIDSENIEAVFPRTNIYNISTKNFSAKDRQYIETESVALYRGWLSSLKAPVINNLPPQYWNREILFPHHLQGIGKCKSIRVPDLIISNNVNDIKEFFKANGKTIFYTPLSGAGTKYEINTDDKFNGLRSLTRYTPVTLTQNLTGKICNIFYASGNFFIQNDEEDQNTKIFPASVLNECKKIASSLDMKFLSFNFVVKKNVHYLTSISLNPELTNCSPEISYGLMRSLFRSIRQ